MSKGACRILNAQHRCFSIIFDIRKIKRRLVALSQGVRHGRFRSVVAITFASHAKGPGFEPQRNHNFCFFSSHKFIGLSGLLVSEASFPFHVMSLPLAEYFVTVLKIGPYTFHYVHSSRVHVLFFITSRVSREMFSCQIVRVAG